jgi:drug/metabolite transporter (DMT)-like permease
MGRGQTAKGVELMVAANVFFCLMSALVKYVSNIDSYKTTLFRFVVGLGLLGTAALFGKIKLEFVHGPFLFLRGLFGSIAVFIFFLSITKLGIAKATVLICSYPIFASIFSAIFLKEKMGILKLTAILMAFAGIYLITMDNSAGLFSLAALGKYELITILGAVLSGIAVVFVKKLHDTDSSYAIFFAQCIIGLWLVIIPASATHCVIGYWGAIILVCIGVISAVGQLLMTEGYRHVTVTTGSLLAMLVPVLNYFVGVIIFNEAISLRSIIGTAIVIVSCTVVLAVNDKT